MAPTVPSRVGWCFGKEGLRSPSKTLMAQRLPTPPTTCRREREGGVALVLALIFAILLYILVAELVVSGRMVRATGENDALLARMRNQMVYQLADAEEDLLGDLAGQAADAESAGGGGGGLGALAGAANAAGSGGGNGAPATGEEEAADPSTKCDSSRDGWFHPVGHADNDLTTYVWVEDENRKLNILALWSPDEKFAEFSRDRLVRLLDTLREDTEFDIPVGDAERIVQELKDWVGRPDLEAIPRPHLKSDDEKRRDVTAIMHLDELLMLPSVNEELFFDKVIDGKVYPGLESVLTIWTSLRVDPGDPEKVARQRAAAQARGETPPATTTPGGDQAAVGGSGAGGTPSGSGSGAGGSGDAPQQPDGLGILINVNTAPRAVLRALFPPSRIPDRVIDAILKYRNEVDEEEMKKLEEQEPTTDVGEFGDLRLGPEKKLKFFETVADLENVEEFANLQDAQAKADFQAALTTKSEVFTIHLATLFKRNEENRVYLLRRARSIVLRHDDGADGQIVPLVPFEERTGLRVQLVDLQEESQDMTLLYSEMDQFAQEERIWNPFLVDFYLPKHLRDEFYSRR